LRSSATTLWGRITDFRDLELRRGGKASRERRWLAQDKGFAGELLAFAKGEVPDFCRGVSRRRLRRSWHGVDRYRDSREIDIGTVGL